MGLTSLLLIPIFLLIINCAHDPSKVLYSEAFLVDPANQEVDMADGKPIPIISKSDITVRIKFNRYEYFSASHLMVFDVHITNQNAKKITVKPTHFLFMGKKLPDAEGIVHTSTGIAIDPMVKIQDLEQRIKAASTPSAFDTLELTSSDVRKKNQSERLKQLGQLKLELDFWNQFFKTTTIYKGETKIGQIAFEHPAGIKQIEIKSRLENLEFSFLFFQKN